MKFFDIPTDSLYKFMALSGLAMIIASYFPAYHGIMEEEGIGEIEGKIKLFIIETRWANEDINSIDFKIKILIPRISELTGLSETEIYLAINSGLSVSKIVKKYEEHRALFEELEAKLLEKRKLSREYELKKNQFATYGAILEEHSNNQLIFLIIALVGSLTYGLPLTAAGFILWYKKLQVPQDLLIQKKLLE